MKKPSTDQIHAVVQLQTGAEALRIAAHAARIGDLQAVKNELEGALSMMKGAVLNLWPEARQELS